MGIRPSQRKVLVSAAQIDLIIYDFDGVMTDNRVFVLQDGTEAIIANRADGLGIDLIRKMGIPQLIISTESNSIVKARADKLRLPILFDTQDKRKTMMDFCAKNGHDPARILYLGNDTNDFEAMCCVGYPVAPADAHAGIKKISKIVLKTKGGYGVIRELADLFTNSGPQNRG